MPGTYTHLYEYKYTLIFYSRNDTIVTPKTELLRKEYKIWSRTTRKEGRITQMKKKHYKTPIYD